MLGQEIKEMRQRYLLQIGYWRIRHGDDIKMPTLIDFEGASKKRKVSNVTSASQGLFIGSYTAKMLGKIRKAPRKSTLISALRRYKENPGRETFEELLCVMRL